MASIMYKRRNAELSKLAAAWREKAACRKGETQAGWGVQEEEGASEGGCK